MYITEEYDVAVLGMGAAGSLTSQKICELQENGRPRYPRVVAIDQNSDLLGAGSSTRYQSNRIHRGKHYCHVPTVRECWRKAEEFLEYFGEECITECDSQYFHMSNSLCTDMEIFRQHNVLDDLRVRSENGCRSIPPMRHIDLRSEGQHLGKDIPSIDSWGKPIIAQVTSGIEISEPLVNIKMMRDKLKSSLASFQGDTGNLTLVLSTRVLAVDLCPDTGFYLIKLQEISQDNVRCYRIRARRVMNCLWQNAAAMQTGLGFYRPDGRIVRIKVSLVVSMPVEEERIKPTMFAYGPHCSITREVMDDEDADGEYYVLTYEPVGSRFGQYTPGFPMRCYVGGDPTVSSAGQIAHKRMLKLMEALAADGTISLDSKLGQEVAEGIVDGVARYVPIIEKCTVIEVRVSNVLMPPDSDGICSIKKPMTDPDHSGRISVIHSRKGLVVECVGPGYFNVPAPKSTYCVSVGNTAAKLAILDDHVQSFTARLREAVKQELERFFNFNRREFVVLDFSQSRQDVQVVKQDWPLYCDVDFVLRHQWSMVLRRTVFHEAKTLSNKKSTSANIFNAQKMDDIEDIVDNNRLPELSDALDGRVKELARVIKTQLSLRADMLVSLTQSHRASRLSSVEKQDNLLKQFYRGFAGVLQSKLGEKNEARSKLSQYLLNALTGKDPSDIPWWAAEKATRSLEVKNDNKITAKDRFNALQALHEVLRKNMPRDLLCPFFSDDLLKLNKQLLVAQNKVEALTKNSNVKERRDANLALVKATLEIQALIKASQYMTRVRFHSVMDFCEENFDEIRREIHRLECAVAEGRLLQDVAEAEVLMLASDRASCGAKKILARGRLSPVIARKKRGAFNSQPIINITDPDHIGLSYLQIQQALADQNNNKTRRRESIASTQLVLVDRDPSEHYAKKTISSSSSSSNSAHPGDFFIRGASIGRKSTSLSSGLASRKRSQSTDQHRSSGSSDSEKQAYHRSTGNLV